ncbi:MAG: hypothetical protein IIA85_00270 [Nanoarchaeota archaeon]|nr:hypothetical protein [Nanoarchaeota archaeon]
MAHHHYKSRGPRREKVRYTGPTPEEVDREMARFKREGGLAQRLPDEINPAITLVEPRDPMNDSPYEYATSNSDNSLIGIS